MGAIKPDQPFSRKINIRLNSIELTQHLGHTKYDDWIHSTFVDANIGFSRYTSMQIRFPSYTIIEGKMPTTKGWGDVLVNINRNVFRNDAYQVNLTLGAKIFTSRANKQSDSGVPMPMYHQTSNGSNDINFGVSILTRKWLLATGYQRVLNQVRNDFTHDAWQGDELQNIAMAYEPSSGLLRGDDLMFRLERNFRLSHYNFYVGSLNLWRLNPDQIQNSDGQMMSVKGSTGLASNFILGGGYQFNAQMGIRLLASFRLKERDSNPDGLSRDFITQLAYIVRF